MLPHFTQKPFDVQYFQHLKRIAPANLIAYWPLWEASGAVAADNAVNEHLANGGFETAGAGGADVWGSWTETAGSGALANETTLVHGGSDAAKITAGATANTKVAQTITTVAGENYELEFWTRGDGTYAGRYGVYDVTGSADIVAAVTTGVAGTTYTMVQVRFTTPASCVSVRLDLWCPATNTGIAYFDDVSVKGRQKHNGTYSNVTLAQAGIGDGRTSASFNGTTSTVDVFSAVLASDFNGAEGTLACWAKVSAAGIWADSTARNCIEVGSATQYIYIKRDTPNNELQVIRNVGGGDYDYVNIVTAAPTGWFHCAITWSDSGDKLIAYYNGTQSGSTQTGIGLWSTTLTYASIGSQNGGGVFWSGLLAHVALWTTPLSAQQVAELARISV